MRIHPEAWGHSSMSFDSQGWNPLVHQAGHGTTGGMLSRGASVALIIGSSVLWPGLGIKASARSPHRGGAALIVGRRGGRQGCLSIFVAGRNLLVSGAIAGRGGPSAAVDFLCPGACIPSRVLP